MDIFQGRGVPVLNIVGGEIEEGGHVLHSFFVLVGRFGGVEASDFENRGGEDAVHPEEGAVRGGGVCHAVCEGGEGGVADLEGVAHALDGAEGGFCRFELAFEEHCGGGVHGLSGLGEIGSCHGGGVGTEEGLLPMRDGVG